MSTSMGSRLAPHYIAAMRRSLLVIATLVIPLALSAPTAGQSESPAPPMGASWFTGTCEGSDGTPGSEVAGPGYRDLVAAVGHCQVVADDARISGAFTQVATIRIADNGVGVGFGTTRVENPNGAWVGTNTTYGGPPGHEEWCVLAGQGAYAGLTAVFRLRAQDGTVEGVIVPFELPPMPDASAPPSG